MPGNNAEPFKAQKVPLDLIERAWIEDVARALATGSKKYGRFNWRGSGVLTSQYVAASLRHIFAYADGEDLDPESGISHLAHACAGLMILHDSHHRHPECDDRPGKEKGPL